MKERLTATLNCNQCGTLLGINKPGELATVICSNCQADPKSPQRNRLARNYRSIIDRYINAVEFLAKAWSPFLLTLFLASLPLVVILGMSESRQEKACLVGAEEVLRQFHQGKSSTSEFKSWKKERLETAVGWCKFKLEREFDDLYGETVVFIIFLLVGMNVFKGSWWKKTD